MEKKEEKKAEKKKRGRFAKKEPSRREQLIQVLDEIDMTKGRIAEWQEHLQELYMHRDQLEDEEILDAVRFIRLDDRSLLTFLDQVKDGRLTFHARSDIQADIKADTEADTQSDIKADTQAEEPDGGTEEPEEDWNAAHKEEAPEGPESGGEQ